MKNRRGSLYLLTGLFLGISLGLLYAWVIAPPSITDAHPDSLRQDFKDRYRIQVASAFVLNGDLVRARARLEKLDDGDPYPIIFDLARRFAASGGSQEELRALQLLAAALREGGSARPTLSP